MRAVGLLPGARRGLLASRVRHGVLAVPVVSAPVFRDGRTVSAALCFAVAHRAETHRDTLVACGFFASWCGGDDVSTRVAVVLVTTKGTCAF